MKEFVKGSPFFSSEEKCGGQYSYCEENLACDVLVIGGGIDGSIAARYFAKENIDVVVVEKHRVGMMNTSSATALLEYQLDDNAAELENIFSKKEVLDLYHLGLSALDEIEKVAGELEDDVKFSRRNTLMYTANEKEVKELYDEYIFRKENGLDVDFLTPENSKFNFHIEGGVLAKNGGAEFNPYLFATSMMKDAEKLGARIYENTEVISIEKLGENFIVHLNYGYKITCKKIIASTGYDYELFTSEKLCDKKISYTIVTQPLPELIWEDRTLVQDNSDPYHYMRLTSDDRIIIGGEDIPFKNDIIDEEEAEKKYEKLLDHLKTLFPALADDIRVDFKFCGAFSETENNLAVIGESEEKGLYFNFGCGANGIIYCVYGVKILLDLYHGRKNKFEKYFSPLRNKK